MALHSLFPESPALNQPPGAPGVVSGLILDVNLAVKRILLVVDSRELDPDQFSVLCALVPDVLVNFVALLVDLQLMVNKVELPLRAE